jgi:hypothetical protein
MKQNYKYLLSLLLISTAVGFLSRCSEDEAPTPFVSYIRVTDPTASDSLLVSGGQGQMIAIMGQNLQNVRQIWFNDQKAQVVPTFVTNTTVITRVPSQIPNTINNKMKMIFSNGDSLFYDFSVDINEPLIDHARSEYVNEGDSLFIYGNYFYKPLTVTFTGGVQAEILSIASNVQSIVVKVPAGAQPGPITVTSNFGATESDLWFRDNRNVIASFDIPLANGMWHVHDVVSSDPSIPNIDKKFLRVNKGALGAYPYLEVYEGPQTSDLKAETKNIPEAAFLAPAKYSLKFEISTLASLTGANLRLYLGNDSGHDFGAARNNYYYVWQPNLTTMGGEWQTVTIPWADVLAANNQDASKNPAVPPFVYNSAGYGMGMYFHGPNPAKYNLAIDNMRVVPNTTE